ncbi:MAG TPA: YbaK/EbsC family protein [Candidatus Eisenbacteria bacterium]
MAINERIRALLERERVTYLVHPHREVFSSREVAQATHVPGRRLAKAVVLRHGRGGHFLYVLPATDHVKLSLVHRLTRLDHPQFASEAEIALLFPDCEVGAIPPFGQLYGLPTYVDPCLLGTEWVYFEAGSHRQLIGIRGEDFERLERPARVAGCAHVSMEPSYS